MKKTKIIMLFCMVAVLVTVTVVPGFADIVVTVPTTNPNFVAMFEEYMKSGIRGDFDNFWSVGRQDLDINEYMGGVNFYLQNRSGEGCVTSISPQQFKIASDTETASGRTYQFIVPKVQFSISLLDDNDWSLWFSSDRQLSYSAIFNVTPHENIIGEHEVRIVLLRDGWDNNNQYPHNYQGLLRARISGTWVESENKIYWDSYEAWQGVFVGPYDAPTWSYQLDGITEYRLEATIVYSRESNSDRGLDRQRMGILGIAGATWSQSAFKDINAWRVAINQGYTYGYNGGYTIGKNQGYTEGHQVGYDDGYQQGTIDGVVENENAFLNMVTAIFTAPATFIDSIFGFEIFGIDLAGLIKTILTLCIVGAIVFFVWRAVR